MKKLMIILSIGLIIFLMIQFPHAMSSPGKLTAGHQKLNNECLSCHTPFAGIANEKCISCHTLENIGKSKTGNQQKPLFHQQISNQKCSACHSEHAGLNPENPFETFKHNLLPTTIINNCNSCHNKPDDNLHLQVSSKCNNCHQTMKWQVGISFDHESLLNKNNCVSCHQKPKDNYHKAISGDCNSCHSTSKWVPSTFDHSAYFKLDQNHIATCNTCHLNNNYSSFTCYGCHQHTESDIIAEHNEEGIYNISNCVACHKGGSEEDEKDNGKSLNDDDRKKLNELILYSERKKMTTKNNTLSILTWKSK